MEEIRFYSKYLVLAVAILGTFKYKDIKDSKAKYFLFSIWYIVITEFVGANFYKWFGEYNYPVYALYTFVQITFYLWWYRSLLRSVSRRKVVGIFIGIYVIFCILNAIFIQDIFTKETSYAFSLGVIFLVTTICFYLIEVFNNEKVLKLRSSIYFWFSLGLLVFHAAFMPFYFAYKYLLFENAKLVSMVNFFLCVFMYCCFAIGFFMAKKSAKEHKLN